MSQVMNMTPKTRTPAELEMEEFDRDMETFLDLYEAKTGRAEELIKRVKEQGRE